MIEFEVKSKTQPIGKRKGQTVYFAQPVSQQHLTNKMVVDRIVRETSLSAGDVNNALISLGAIVRDAFEFEERNNIWNTPYLFNAKEFDEETGMYYYGARYYEPRLSLWMSTDPMEEKYPATSSYCFVANNPIKYFDLDGLQLWVANNEAMSLLLHTLAPEDRGYVVRDKNGFIDSKILTEGVKHSVSNSE